MLVPTNRESYHTRLGSTKGLTLVLLLAQLERLRGIKLAYLLPVISQNDSS